MNKGDLIDRVASDAAISKAHADRAIDLMLGGITDSLRKGHRVTLYLPMTPDAAVAMLACARIGAVHSVVFGGFSPEALAGRIADCGSRLVITADEGVRGGKTIPLKRNVDDSLAILATNLFGATPAEAVMPTVSKMRRRISCAISVALPLQWGESDTSR